METGARRLVAGRFDVIDTLGRGGMGVVYRARDRDRGVDVALKTLRGVTPESVLRFKTEFRALADVRHPNLVELGELFENEGVWFFTMELVRGKPLLQWVLAQNESGDTIPSPTITSGAATAIDGDRTSIEAPPSVLARNQAQRARRIDKLPAPCCDVDRLRTALAGLARGLSALHGAGKVHRDVKPSNILVEDDGRVVLLDFGVVAELNNAEHEKLLFGTVKYMAPEQARGEVVGPAADWYAVGVIMYQALAGQLPFANVSGEELLVLKQHVDPPACGELVDGIPADLDQLVSGLLARDPARRPNEAEILDVLGVVDDEAPADAPRPSDLFVGRQRELSVLDEALGASRHAAVTVIVEGESGVGKTALVTRFVELARTLDPRLVVLRGRCHERERVPFNAVDGVLDDLTRFLLVQREARLERLVPDGVGALLAVFPSLRAIQVLADAAALERASTNVDVRRRAFVALRELLAKLCVRRTCVIAIEDLQWADADSCALLDDLLGTADAPRLCLIATRRSTDGARVELPDMRRLLLGGLDAGDAAELVRMVSTRAHAAQIVAETGGHPMFLRELALQPTQTALRLDDAIRARVARLADTAQQLLAAVAVAGSPMPRHILVAATGLSPVQAEPHIAALVRDHLVRAHGPRQQDALEPFHDRIREAITSQLPAARERALQLAFATTLEAAGAPAAQLLDRFDAAGDTQAASKYIVAAAEAARAAFAFGRAAELYQRALRVLELAPDGRAALLVALAESLANNGHTREAAEAFLEAAGLAPVDSEQHLDLLRRAAERFLMSGRLAEGLETTRSVLARAGMTLPTTRVRAIAGIVWNQLRMRGRALDAPVRDRDRSLDADICWSIGAGLGMVDTLLGAYFSGRAARLALRHGNALQVTRGMASATIGAALLDRRKRTARLLACAERAAAADGSPLARWYVGLARTGLSFVLDNDWWRTHQEATALEAEWYAQGHGPSWETDVAMHFSLAGLQMMGEIRELGRRVALLVHGAERDGNLFQEVTLRVRFAIRHLHDDRPDVARRDVNEALAAWLPGTDAFGNQRAWALWSNARTAVYSGELPPELDREWLRMERSLVGRIPFMQGEWLHSYGTFLLARAHAAKKRGLASEHAAFCRAAERVADRATKLVFPAAVCTELVLRAGVAWARGDSDLVGPTRRALDALIEHGVFVYAPFMKRRLGEVIGGDEGAALVSQADDFAQRVGWVDPVRAAELALPTGRFS